MYQIWFQYQRTHDKCSPYETSGLAQMNLLLHENRKGKTDP